MSDFLSSLQQALVAMTLSGSGAICLVLLLRRWLRLTFGAGIAYAAWLLVPASLIGVLLPQGGANERIVRMAGAVVTSTNHVLATIPRSAGMEHGAMFTGFWVVGLLLACGWLAMRQRQFMRQLGSLWQREDGAWQADAVDGLPAAFGLLQPIVVVPADFDTRYGRQQRALMLAHERAHIAHGDLRVNAVVAATCCLFWFNPLVHLAARTLRLDQELACDLRVMTRHPQARRIYGEAMLTTQLPARIAPLGCHWGFIHPMKERIAMLTRPVPSLQRLLAGAFTVIALTLTSGYVAWAAQPGVAPGTMPAVVPDGFVKAQFRMQAGNDAPQESMILKAFDKPFTVAIDGSGHAWRLTGKVTDHGEGKLELAMDWREDGKLIQSPTIWVRAGKTGAISIGDRLPGGRFNGLRMEVLLATTDAQASAQKHSSAPGADGLRINTSLAISDGRTISMKFNNKEQRDSRSETDGLVTEVEAGQLRIAPAKAK